MGIQAAFSVFPYQTISAAIPYSAVEFRSLVCLFVLIPAIMNSPHSPHTGYWALLLEA